MTLNNDYVKSYKENLHQRLGGELPLIYGLQKLPLSQAYRLPLLPYDTRVVAPPRDRRLLIPKPYFVYPVARDGRLVQNRNWAGVSSVAQTGEENAARP